MVCEENNYSVGMSCYRVYEATTGKCFVKSIVKQDLNQHPELDFRIILFLQLIQIILAWT